MALPDCRGFALCWLVVRITDASTRRILTVEEKVKCAIVTVAMPSRPNLEALQNGKKKRAWKFANGIMVSGNVVLGISLEHLAKSIDMDIFYCDNVEVHIKDFLNKKRLAMSG